MKLLRHVLVFSLALSQHLHGATAENHPPFSEAAKVELEKHKMTLDSQYKTEELRAKTEIEKLKVLQNGPTFFNTIYLPTLMGVSALSICFIIKTIKNR